MRLPCLRCYLKIDRAWQCVPSFLQPAPLDLAVLAGPGSILATQKTRPTIRSCQEIRKKWWKKCTYLGTCTITYILTISYRLKPRSFWWRSLLWPLWRIALARVGTWLPWRIALRGLALRWIALALLRGISTWQGLPSALPRVHSFQSG